MNVNFNISMSFQYIVPEVILQPNHKMMLLKFSLVILRSNPLQVHLVVDSQPSLH